MLLIEGHRALLSWRWWGSGLTAVGATETGRGGGGGGDGRGCVHGGVQEAMVARQEAWAAGQGHQAVVMSAPFFLYIHSLSLIISGVREGAAADA